MDVGFFVVHFDIVDHARSQARRNGIGPSVTSVRMTSTKAAILSAVIRASSRASLQCSSVQVCCRSPLLFADFPRKEALVFHQRSCLILACFMGVAGSYGRSEEHTSELK